MSKERQWQGQILYNYQFHELIFQLTYARRFSFDYTNKKKKKKSLERRDRVQQNLFI
jgi:hypothetical protein